MLVGAACLAGCETSQPDNDGQDTEATPGSDEENQDEEIPDDNPDGDETPDDGEKPDDNPDEDLPELEVTDDVCTKMKDLEFMRYCYENFDVNGDKKVAMYEANAVIAIECNDAASFAGLEYFTNLRSFKSSSVVTADFKYNRNLETVDCRNSRIESVNLKSNDKLTSISFSYCSSLNTVSLPANLVSIGDYSFSGCSSLISIVIPGNVTSIGKYSFSDCGALASIANPESITKINMFAFSGCESLVSVDASRCMNFDSISRNAFEGCPIQEFLLGTLMPPSLYDAYNVAIFEYTPEAVLKVPAESVETYKNSDWAEYFPNIVALEQ